MKKEIIFYQKVNGDIPVKMFLDSLKVKNPHIWAKIQSKLELLSENLLGLDDLKYLGEKIFELRIKKGTDISRLFYFTLKDDTIILLDGIIKKDNKLKKGLINKMVHCKNDYLERMKNNGLLNKNL